MDAVEDVTDMTDEELAEKAEKIQTERHRRSVVTDAEKRTDAMCLEYLQASGRENGGPFEAPTGFIGAYPRGWRVTQDGRAFEALVPGVTTAPPGECWTEVDPASPLTPFWQPGEHSKGDQVRDAGVVWRALADTTDGPRPSEYPGGWTIA
ncbi:MAG: hypothetical protein L0G94_07200 [Brachybacterium sp.]|uniref:hypothetical protein n=1 Tax=Brachybacterium sp. TaxID=1891286 RepID=UPI00264A407B|nr:hypothetical protein [Brachybacterium sp.]MDN5686457.1 hypothetical protein [Brachybacterium sp.]